MSSLSLRLPDSIHRHLKRAADEDGISINQIISLAVAGKPRGRLAFPCLIPTSTGTVTSMRPLAPAVSALRH